MASTLSASEEALCDVEAQDAEDRLVSTSSELSNNESVNYEDSDVISVQSHHSSEDESPKFSTSTVRRKSRESL